LQNVLKLRPDHISCYGLRIEEGTPMASYRDCLNLADDDTQADMYLYAASTLDSYGYRQYEVSNFAREGHESLHNLRYWLGGEYMGFGPSAASDFAGKRYTYQRSLRGYIDGIFGGTSVMAECDEIPLRERAAEYLMLRLRTRYGVEAGEYSRLYRMDFAPLEEIFQQLRGARYAVKDNGRWRLTSQGMLLSNPIIVALQEAQRETTTPWKEHGFLG